MPPSEEYLRVLQELRECRNDDALHLIHAKLQDAIDSESRRILVQNSLVERYKNMRDMLHIYCALIIKLFGEKRRLEFVATCRAANGEIVSLGPGKFGSVVTLRIEDVQVSVFVDVRQLCERSQDVTGISSVVRLYTLDEFKRLFGNSWQTPMKVVIGQWGSLANGRVALNGNLQQQGEVTSPNPVQRELDSSFIDLDEIECQMVESRFDLIDSFACENGNVEIGVRAKVQCGFAVRMRNNCARLTSGISHNAVFDCVDMRFGSREFEGC